MVEKDSPQWDESFSENSDDLINHFNKIFNLS